MQQDRAPEQQRVTWALLVSQLRQDPRVSQLLSTSTAQYVLGHPALAQALMLFALFAVPPVAAFLAFATVTFIVSAAGFVFFQGFVLLVGGLSLLCTLVALAFLSAGLSLVFNALFFIVSSILGHAQLAKYKVQAKES